MLPPGVPPHWLPYVFVDDADATIAKAKKGGGTVQFGPENIPGIGRFGVIQDPTGAVIAVMKPRPSEDQR
jgi:predicted enzyme related to lactoylglutathione lyase